MPKTTKLEFEKRIFTVLSWIVEGVPTALIYQQILNNKWCESKRQAERIHAAAVKRWTEAESDDVEEKRKLKVIELKQLKRSLKPEYKGTPAGIRTMVLVEKEIIKLENLRPAQKIELSGKDGKPIEVESKTTLTLSNEEIRKISSALEDEV